jgi:hypothetical protein
MTPEQIITLVGTIVAAPFLIELIKNWFKNRNLKLQAENTQAESRDEREWKAMESALDRERKLYNDTIDRQRAEFTDRITSIELRLATIQQENLVCQKAYWEEKAKRELLQARVESLEEELQILRKNRKNDTINN